MQSLADRLLRVALLGVVPADDPHVIADAQAEIERLGAALEEIASGLSIRDPYHIANEALGRAVTP